MQWRVSLTKLARRTEAGIYSANKVTAVIASIILAAMMILTVADVTGRYCFNSPIKGTWELVGLLLVGAGTWGWGYCQMEKSHIRVTVLAERLSSRTQLILKNITYLAGLGVFSFICWQMWLRSVKYMFLGSRGLTETLEIPFFPFMLVLTIGCGMLALIILIDLLHALAEVARK